jgi:hypothetical protein
LVGGLVLVFDLDRGGAGDCHEFLGVVGFTVLILGRNAAGFCVERKECRRTFLKLGRCLV